QVWEVKTSRVVRRVESPAEFIGAVALSPDHRFLAMAGSGEGNDHPVRVVELSSGKDVQSLTGTRRVNDIVFGRDGRTVTAVDIQGTFLWTMADGKLLQQINRTYSHSLSPSADGHRLLLAGPFGL